MLDRLAIGTYPSLVTFDVDAARARVEALPWVDQATLRKLYPDTLEVAIAERDAVRHLAARRRTVADRRRTAR